MIIEMKEKDFLKQIKSQAGMSILEILVVIAIIGIISGVVLVNMAGARQKSRIAKSEADLKLLRDAVALLESDTGKWPNGCPIEETSNPDVDLDAPAAGIREQPIVGLIDGLCEWTDETVAAWKGPYSDHTRDVWGRSYRFAPDYATNCDGSTVVYRPVLQSLGEDGVQTYPVDASCNPQDTDDVYLIIK
jgi:prepilin-type N-terminal cleavage/methylation domain-containing protein